MRLHELLYTVKILRLVGSTNIEVSNIQFDSRKIQKGDLFVAIEGKSLDGHKYIEDTVRDGARAVLVDRGSQPTTITRACSFSTRVARSAPFPANRAMVPKSRKSRLKRHHEQDVNYCSIIVKLLCSLNYCVSYYKNRE